MLKIWWRCYQICGVTWSLVQDCKYLNYMVLFQDHIEIGQVWWGKSIIISNFLFTSNSHVGHETRQYFILGLSWVNNNQNKLSYDRADNPLNKAC